MSMTAISLILSSFLLFLIQPLIGKYILPWFGSSPSVWSTSLVFFQIALTGGYAYAYLLSQRLSLKKQGVVHLTTIAGIIVVVLFSAVVWGQPLLPDGDWKPNSASPPISEVLKVLVVSVGLPYFLLATNSTLVQAWYNQLFPTKSPYWMYALSNAASLFGLLAYPFLIEPSFPLPSQAKGWTLGFFVFTATLVYIILRELRLKAGVIEEQVNGVIENFDEYDEAGSLPPSWTQRILWILFSATASILLISTTNQITQEVAVIPFLWVLPLSLYLLSFILCFSGIQWYGRGRFVFILTLAVCLYGLKLSQGPLVGIRIDVAVYCLLLFVCCMICHGEVVNLRPHPKYLTQFYLFVSIGGAVGGIFVNLVAPFLFVYYWELAIGFIVCTVLLLIVAIFFRQGNSKLISGVMGMVIILIAVGFTTLTIKDIQNTLRGSVWMSRNFYGVLRVKERLFPPDNDPAWQLVHGITVHGVQFKEPDKRNLATSYYSESSGAGIAFQYKQKQKDSIDAAILGLGIGTQAVYGRSGDHFTFYEINPDVIKIAQGEGGYFSYLGNNPAEINIILGDARLSLDEALESGLEDKFDLIVLDTFSSDAIPVHLITYESFGIYLKLLKTDGILAVHISNNHLDLEPVVLKLAAVYDMKAAVIARGKKEPGSFASVWALLTMDHDFLNLEEVRGSIVDPTVESADFQLWTDDYSNLFQILR